MSERLIGQEHNELEGSEWQLLSEMEPRGYWVGSSYSDFYSNRLQLNVTRFDDICRQLDLPPLEISGVSYNPPSEEYPETVGFGLAAWKKAKTAHTNSNIDPQADYEIHSMPEMMLLNFDQGALPVPLGWKLGIKGRKIERDIARVNHHISRNEEDELFISGFNNALWQGLHKIHAHEWADTRAFGLNSQSRKSSLAIMASAMTVPFTPALFEQLSNVDLSLLESIGMVLGTSPPLQLTWDEIFRRWTEGKNDDEVDMRDKGRVSMLISNSWRYNNFPERYLKEVHGMTKLKEGAIHGLPFVGLAMERSIKYGLVKHQNNQVPLVRMSSE